MSSIIYQSKIIEMKALHNLFIEMTAKNCNQHCKHCYIDFPKYKKEIDFISIDIIKQALDDTKNDDIKFIYLTGAEPMTHPDFNSILRLCLKRSNVCICTNGSFINEKKSRFLKKVEDETDNEIFFKISIDHYDEIKNDDIRYRGAFRHAVFAINHLIKYNFIPIITVTNYYELSKNELIQGLNNAFKRYNIEANQYILQINPYYEKDTVEEYTTIDNDNFDCKTGRILTTSGIYSCPFLSNDYRGRCGSSFVDYNKKSVLESDYCNTCAKSETPIFSIDYTNFDT